MALTHVGTSAPLFFAGNGAPDIPPGSAPGDHAYVYIVTNPDSRNPILQSGWTEIANAIVGGPADTTAACRVTVWYRVVPPEGLTVGVIQLGGTGTGLVDGCSVGVWRSDTGAAVTNTVGIGSDTDASTTTFSATTAAVGLAPADVVLILSATNDDAPFFGASSISASGATFDAPTEIADAGTTQGVDIHFALHHSRVASGTVSAAVTFTSTLSTAAGGTGGSAIVALREASSAVKGSGDGTASATGASSGSPVVTGGGAATASGTGAGAGGRVFAGSASATASATGAGTGTPVVTGAGAATADATGTGSGGPPAPSGSGAATADATGAGSGSATPAGSGSGTGSATGAGAGNPVNLGSAASTADATGAGSGSLVLSGSGTPTASATGAGTGGPVASGNGTATVSATGVGAGAPVAVGSGASSADATGTGNGYAVLATSIRALTEGYEIALSGSGNYAAPTAADLSAMQAIWGKVKTGDLAGANSDAAAYNYEAVRVDDTETGRSFGVLREKATRTKWWGLFVWSREATPSARVVVQSHTGSDLHTEIQAADVLLRGNCRALLATGTHRDASATLDADGDNITDTANADSSVLQSIFESTAVATDTVVEPHGFASAEPMGSAHFVASSSVVLDPAGLSLTVPLPTGAKAGERPLKVGDTMFVLHAIRDAGATYTAPTGWTQVSYRADSGGLIASVVWTKVVTQSDLDSGGFTFAHSTSHKAEALLVAYENVGSYQFVNAEETSGTATTAHTVGPISSSVADSVLLSFFTVTNATAWGTASATTKDRVQARTSATDSSSSVAYDTDNAVQAVGSYSATANNATGSINVAMHLLALRPAATVRATQIILSQGAAPSGNPGAHITALRDQLTAAGYATVANDGTWPFLAARNRQGIYTRGLGGKFAHAEQVLALRESATDRATIDQILAGGAAPLSGSGAATADATGAGSGSAIRAGAGGGSATATGSGAGSRISTGAGGGAADGSGTGTGTLVVPGSGVAAASGTGAGSGTSINVGSGAATAAATGASSGAPVVAGTGPATEAATGIGVGSSVATGAGGGTAAATGTSSGAVVATGAGVATASATGVGGGSPVAAGTAGATASATGEGTGAAVAPTAVTGSGAATATGTAGGSGARVSTGSGSAQATAVGDLTGRVVILGAGQGAAEATGAGTGTAPSANPAVRLRVSVGASPALTVGASSPRVAAVGTSPHVATVGAASRQLAAAGTSPALTVTPG